MRSTRWYTAPFAAPSGALVYIHGGGFTYGTLDEFEVPMRLIAERAGIFTYALRSHLEELQAGAAQDVRWI